MPTDGAVSRLCCVDDDGSKTNDRVGKGGLCKKQRAVKATTLVDDKNPDAKGDRLVDASWQRMVDAITLRLEHCRRARKDGH